MYLDETVHRYPRPLTLSVELLCAAIVTIAAVNLGAVVLRGLWDLFALDRSLTNTIPLLGIVITWIEGTGGRLRADTLTQLFDSMLPALFWAAAALFLGLLLRNAFPIVRTSSRGMLVQFADDWLPMPWEELRAIKVTEDLSGQHFVLLAQSQGKHLTTWHRIYSLIYRFTLRRGFLVTSSISDFDRLVQTMLSEGDRAARAGDDAQTLQLDERAQSPLFRLLLSPAAFFSRRPAAATGDDADDVVKVVAMGSPPAAAGVSRGEYTSTGPVRGSYPAQVTALLTGATALFAILLVVQYLSYWVRFLALQVPALRTVAPFSWVFTNAAYVELYNAFRTRAVPLLGIPGRPDLPAPWWLLIAAHLFLVLGILLLVAMRNLLPTLESRDEGMAVRNMLNGKWKLIPWHQIRAFKATEVSETNQVLLMQAQPQTLSASHRLYSMFYDGSFKPGVLMTSAITNFQPLLQHALGQIAPLERSSAPQILQQEARSWMLWLALRPGAALDEFTRVIRDNPLNSKLNTSALLDAAKPMALLALPPALLYLINDLLLDGSPPRFGLLLAMFAIWFVGILEWPLVSLLSVVLDDATGGGEEGYRAFYAYPTSQLPRLLPMGAVIVFQLFGVPLLPIIIWISAIVWSFWLAAGLWEALYKWQGTQALFGGLFPVVWQLFLLLAYLIF